jgi:hypothetical protein
LTEGGGGGEESRVEVRRVPFGNVDLFTFYQGNKERFSNINLRRTKKAKGSGKFEREKQRLLLLPRMKLGLDEREW